MSQALKIRGGRARVRPLTFATYFRFVLAGLLVMTCALTESIAQTGHAPARKTMELSDAVNAALRSELHAEGNEAERAAVQQLADLQTELKQHPRFEASELLQRHVRRINVRLLRIFDRLTDDFSADIENTKKIRPEPAAHSRIAAAPDDATFVLGQRLGPQQGGNAQVGRNQVDNQINTMNPGGNKTDHSAVLIDIIASTITPDTWDRVGGPSSLLYYPQGMALVVRAPQEVHDDMRDLLLQLRAAGP